MNLKLIIEATPQGNISLQVVRPKDAPLAFIVGVLELVLWQTIAA